MIDGTVVPTVLVVDLLRDATSTVVVDLLRNAVVALGGFGLLAALVATISAVAYRRVTTRPLPPGGAVLLGLAPVTGWSVASTAQFGSPLRGAAVSDPGHAATLLALIGGAAILAIVGHRIGDRVACEVYDIVPLEGVEHGSIVASARTTVAVDLPETVGDVPGFDAAAERTKRRLAGRRLRFPRRLTSERRASRLERRLERDFGLDHVAVEFGDDGSVDRLAVGIRRDGIGPTLPPETVAVAVEAPAPRSAAPGDPIELWTGGEASRFVAAGEIRAVTGEVVTVVVAESDGAALEPDGETNHDGASETAASTYRIVARSDRGSEGHAFLSTLRTMDASVTSLTVESGGRLDGEFVDWLSGTVLVIARDDELHTVPAGNETLRAGDRLWVLGPPDAGDQSELADVPAAGPPPDEDAVEA